MPQPIPTPGTWTLNNSSSNESVTGNEMSETGYSGSMQQILSQNTGNFVICEFLVGTQTIVRKEGVLFHVGVSYLTLFNPAERHYTVCDFYSLKFVTFLEPGNTRLPSPDFPNGGMRERG